MKTFNEYLMAEDAYKAGFDHKPEVTSLHAPLSKKGFGYTGEHDGWHTWSHPAKGDVRYNQKFGYEHRQGKKMLASGYPANTSHYVNRVLDNDGAFN